MSRKSDQLAKAASQIEKKHQPRRSETIGIVRRENGALVRTRERIVTDVCIHIYIHASFSS